MGFVPVSDFSLAVGVFVFTVVLTCDCVFTSVFKVGESFLFISEQEENTSRVAKQ